MLKNFEKICAGPLFLILCILMTLGAALSALGTLDPFALLYAIALWLIYVAARTGKLQKRQAGLKMFSGIVKTKKIILWVLVGIFVFFSLLFLFLAQQMQLHMLYTDVLERDPFDKVFSASEQQVIHELSMQNGMEVGFLMDNLAALFGIGVKMIFSVMLPELAYYVFHGYQVLFAFAYASAGVAVVLGLINLLIYRNLNKFTKSVCDSFAYEREAIKKVKAARNACLVVGVVSVIFRLITTYALQELFSLLSGACVCVCYFLLFALGNMLVRQMQPAPVLAQVPVAPPVQPPVQDPPAEPVIPEAPQSEPAAQPTEENEPTQQQ